MLIWHAYIKTIFSFKIPKDMNKRLFSLCIALAAVTVSAMAETFYGIYVGKVDAADVVKMVDILNGN